MGTDAIPFFEFYQNHTQKKTYLTQQMLKNKILATNMIYVTIHHNKKNIKKYLKILDEVFFDLAKKNLKKILKSKISYKPIRRIN